LLGFDARDKLRARRGTAEFAPNPEGRPGGTGIETTIYGMPAHSLYNQSEHPRSQSRAYIAAGIQRAAPSLTYGDETWIPYHKDNYAIPGVFRPFNRYPMTPVVLAETYKGEAFLRMQEQPRIPHPSGLSDYSPLSGPELANLMGGG